MVARNRTSQPTTERKEVMPKASRTSATETVEVEGYEGHMEQLEGGYTVAFEKYTADADLAEFFTGLPDDQCQAAHWGYVLAGKVTFRTASGEETFEAGDAYYVPPGHTPMLFANTEVVEFSPTEQLQQTLEVVTKNMQAAG
jgi:mannose-6-phosphate isomerase-like protein (cupin superfamily)